jgi:hypothetical protein
VGRMGAVGMVDWEVSRFSHFAFHFSYAPMLPLSVSPWLLQTLRSGFQPASLSQSFSDRALKMRRKLVKPVSHELSPFSFLLSPFFYTFACSKKLSRGVTGNTSDFGSEKFRFEP